MPNQTTRVVPSAIPLSYEAGERAVLLIHGFTGFPEDMRYLAEELYRSGFTVRVPRLPGHGTDGADFLSTGRRDWLRTVTDEYLDLAAVYREVFVAGLSMGGLLAVLLGATFPIERVALLAPALELRNKFVAFSGLLGLFRKRIRSGPHEEYENQDMEYISREYWDYIWPGQTWQLLRLQNRARRSLSRLTADLLTIVSEADETVPPTAASMIEVKATRARRRNVVLKTSSHVITRDSEAERVASEVIRFFS